MRTLSLFLLLSTLVQSQDSFGIRCDESTVEPVRTYSDGYAIAKAEHRPILVFLTQPNCPPCRVAKKALEAMRLKCELRDCVVVEMDASEPEANETFNGRRHTPQLMLLDTRFENADKTVDKFGVQAIDTASICRLLDQLPIQPIDPITVADLRLDTTEPTFDAEPLAGPPPRVITYSIATQYRNGAYQGTFDWGAIDSGLNFLARYKNVVYKRVNSGARLMIVQANYQLNVKNAFAWTSGNTIYISPVANYGRNSGLCKKVILHENGHAIRGGVSHNMQQPGVMSPNAGTSGNLLESDYPWYAAYPWKSALRPHHEPDYMRQVFNGSMSLHEQVETIPFCVDDKWMRPFRDHDLQIAP